MNEASTTPAANPLLEPWDTPHGLPPFSRFDPARFQPALEAAMQAHRDELQAIARQDAAPSFENTVAAFDRAGRLLGRIETVFFNLTASETSPALQAVQREMAGPLAAHANSVYMNAALFARIDALHDVRATLELTPEQRRLLERIHFDFVSSGARLQGPAQARYAAVMEELARLTTRFSQNVLHDEASFQLLLRTEQELDGLPDFVRDAARQAARDRGLQDDPQAHVITLSRSLIVPFLTFSARRDLREQAWRAWTSRGEHPGEHDNREVARAILKLRREQAVLHGYPSFADYALVDRMAGTQQAVRQLLDGVWPRALAAVERERQMLRSALVDAGQGAEAVIEPWDWRFWAEKVRVARYAVDDAEVKPFFQLDRMVQAAFDCAGRLFGLQFRHRPDLPVYHPDVKAYEVCNAAGLVCGIFLQDNFARPTKRSGAWMSSLRWQNRNVPQEVTLKVQEGAAEIPVILNNNNFAKGAPGAPTLLSMDDVRTLFHEFGHGLHGLLSNVTYERLSGTQVLRDFVELPSQLFEHWASEPAVLKQHARHWQTDEPIPDELLERLQRARRFNQGYETVRYTASALVDMAVHALTDEEPPADLSAFEAQELQRLGLPHGVGLNHRLVHFQHLFSSSGYAAGYYVYLWAEVLDADAFDAFVEADDPFDPQTAQALQRFVYGSGNSLEPGAAFASFRGRQARVEPMLRKKGLLEDLKVD
ncbi:MAG: M3 family metallopeptidase [Rubrivivax sp.]